MNRGCFTGIGTTLTIIFVTLKLTGFIDWPWAWVLFPFWFPLAMGLMGILIAVLIQR